MAVSFLPFPTKLMAEAIRNTDAERAAVIFYGGSLLVIALLVSTRRRAIARRRDLLRPDVSEDEINELLRATTPNIGFYVGEIVLAIVAPVLAPIRYLLIAILLVLRARGDQEPTTTAAGPG